jgi:hypothetical protein
MNPLVVHQIWLQGGPLPAVLGALVDGVQFRCRVSSRWEYRLWDEASIRYLSAEARDLWHRLAPLCCHASQRSNLLRYLVLYEFGGLYLDTDVELFYLPEAGFDGSWVTGVQDGDSTCVNTCAISCVPRSCLVWRVLDRLPHVNLGEHMSAGAALLRACLDADVGVWPVACWHGRRGQPDAFGHHYGWGHLTRSFARNPPGLGE